MTIGRPGLMMPAFSPAMAASVVPRNASWSIDSDAIAQEAGACSTLVASNRPPSPTSMIARSAGVAANSRKAQAVSTSNTVIGAPALTTSMRSSADTSVASSTSRPATRNRSVTSTRCGLVVACTTRPAASAMARMWAQVLPLPLVPATWTTGGRCRSGWPSLPSSTSSRPRLRSISTG